MIKEIPARRIEVCDCCGRGGYLMTCKACGGKYCVFCDALIVGSVHKLELCGKCGARESVKVVVEKYEPELVAILKRRDCDLGKLKS